MRTCVIFNPTAKGEKARRFRRHLDKIGAEAKLKLTTAPGDARRLAAEAVEEGFEIVVAAGGDGTVNEVLNGLGDSSEGFDRARLAVLPLGTVNVFARELALPIKLEKAWDIIRHGNETLIDLPKVEYSASEQGRAAMSSSRRAEPQAEQQEQGRATMSPSRRAESQPEQPMKQRRDEDIVALPRVGERASQIPRCRYFAQLAGAGLDARAIELVSWPLKKRIGPLAYVLAGMQALLGKPFDITASGNGHSAAGGLVLIGNGRLYGGDFQIFPRADLRDGLLEVCVLPKVTWLTLARCGPQMLLRGTLPASATRLFQAESVTLASPVPAPLEVDGEWLGHLPAKFLVAKSRLRVIVP